MLKQSLVIYDVSYLIHVGTKSEHKSRSTMGVPCGGLDFLFEKVFLHISQGKCVALCFDSYCNKKELFPEYKSTRPRDNAISLQCKIAYDFAVKMGIPAYRLDGYEADEMIYNVVEKNRTVFPEITIYAHDADIDCNVIHRGVKVVGCTSNAPVITTDSYPFEIFAGETVEYNTILPFILCFGKSSNNIAPLSLSLKVKNDVIYRDFIAYCDSKQVPEADRCKKTHITRWILSKSGKLPETDIDQLLRRVNMIWPRATDELKFIANLDFKALLDLQVVERFLRMFGMYTSAMNMDLSAAVNSRVELPKSDIALLMQYRTMLETGVPMDYDPGLLSDFVSSVECAEAVDSQGSTGGVAADTTLFDQPMPF